MITAAESSDFSPPSVSACEGVLTLAGYATEAEACAALDAALARAPQAFRIYSEVAGFYLQPRPWTDRPTCRVDRLLIPLPPLIQAGWTAGAFAIEIKRSGTKAGPVIAQAADYGRAAFTLPGCGVSVLPSWTFIFALGKTYRDVASFMAQHRVGGVEIERSGTLRFWAPDVTAISIGPDGQLFARPPAAGGKAGSR